MKFRRPLTPKQITETASELSLYLAMAHNHGAHVWLESRDLRPVDRAKILTAMKDREDETGIDADTGRLALNKPAKRAKAVKAKPKQRKPLQRGAKVMNKSTQKNLRRRLKAKAWRLFSEYVRQKGADRDGFNECFTCRARFHWTKMNASHLFHGRLDYDPRNVRASCIRCNLYLHGNLNAYAVRVIQEEGLAAYEAIELSANTHKGYELIDLEQIIEKYSKGK